MSTKRIIDASVIRGFATSPIKNYVQFGSFEEGNTNGWSLGTIGTLTNGLPTGTPTFGSGASGNLSISATSSSPIAGAFSLSLASSAATTSGNMVASQAYSIDAGDQAKVLTVKGYYSIPTNGLASGQLAGTSANAIAWAVYDVTNSAWLTSAGNFNFVQSTGVGYFTGTVQTAPSTASIRLVIYFPNATSSATTFYLDDLYVGPQTAPVGPAMDDLAAVTPTFSAGIGASPTNVSVFSGRMGDCLWIEGSFTAGTTAGSAATISLAYKGTTLTADSAKLSTGAYNVVGQMATNGSNANPLQMIIEGGQTALSIGAQGLSSGGVTPQNGGSIIASGALVTFWAKVPIVGWSSNTSMSSDTDTRVAAVQVTGTTTSIGTATAITPTTIVRDTHGGWSGTQYKVPVSGWYQVNGYIQAGSNAATYEIDYDVNGAGQTPLGGLRGGTGFQYASGSDTTYCNAGDTIRFIGVNTGTAQAPTAFHGSIFRLTGPAVVAATESVNARYTLAGTVTTAGSTQTTVTYDTKDFDSHSAVSGGIFTAPVSGTYLCNGSGSWNALGASNTTASYISIFKNNAEHTRGNETPNSSEAQTVQVTGLVKLNAGDNVRFKVYQSVSGSINLNVTSSFFNVMNICRVGN